MKILLLNPSSFFTSNVIRDAIYGCWCKGKRIGGALTPPLPLLSIGTVLKQDGHDVTLIDAPAQRITLQELELKVKAYDIIVVLTSVMTFQEDDNILRLLKEKKPSLKSVIFGSLPTFIPEFALSQEHKGVDIIVKGEAEFVLKELLNKMENSADWRAQKGIGVRENEKVIINEDFPYIENLDEIPHTDWNFLDPDSVYFNPLIKRYPYVTDLTSRGCPYKCTYCMAPRFYGKKVRYRSIGHVLEGFRQYKKRGIKEIYFRDELFTSNRSRIVELCEKMIEENFNFSWLCSAKIGTVDLELLKLMRKAGCHTIKYGVESGSQEILNKIKKGIKVDQTIQTFKNTHEVGIDSHAHVMVGLPGESEDSLNLTLKLLKKIDPTTTDIGIMTPYPGTEIFDEMAIKSPSLSKDLFLNLEMLHSKSFWAKEICKVSDKDIEKWLKKMHRAIYLRPSYILKWLKKIKSFPEFIQVAKAGFNVIYFSFRGDK